MVQGVANPGDLLADAKKREKDELGDELIDDFATSIPIDELLGVLDQGPSDYLDLIVGADPSAKKADADAERFEFMPGVFVEVSDWANDEGDDRSAIFSLGQNNRADEIVRNKIEAGNSSFGGVALSRHHEEEEKRKKRDDENQLAAGMLLRSTLAAQIEWLRGEIEKSKDRIDHYHRRLGILELQARFEERFIELGKRNIAALETMDQDMTLDEFYQKRYADKVFVEGSDGLLNSMQNPLTVNGDIVYGDAQGYYRLKHDEDGQLALDSNGLPERVYDFSPAQVQDIVRQIREDGRLLGQYTPVGQDPTNIRWQTLINVKDMPPGLREHIDQLTPPNADGSHGHPPASVQTIGDMHKFCDESMCRLIDQHGHTIDEIENVEELIEGEEKHLQATQQQLSDTEKRLEAETGTTAQTTETKSGANTTAQTAQSGTEQSAQGTPAPAFDTGKLPEAIASQIEGGKLDAETLSFAMADLTDEQKATLLRNLEHQGVQITVSTVSFIDPALAPYIKDEQKPQIFGGNGVYAFVPAPADDLPVVDAKATSFARSIDDETGAPSKMSMSFASAAKGPQTAPELAPPAPAPEQNLNPGLVA